MGTVLWRKRVVARKGKVKTDSKAADPASKEKEMEQDGCQSRVSGSRRRKTNLEGFLKCLKMIESSLSGGTQIAGHLFKGLFGFEDATGCRLE